MVGYLSSDKLRVLELDELNITYDFKEMRILKPALPTVVEFHEITGVYAGSNNGQQNELLYSDRTYTESHWRGDK